MALEKELETYRRVLPDHLASQGQYILIQGDDVLGVWQERAKALEEGYARFGLNQPFLVRKIQVVHPPIFLPYDVFRHADANPGTGRKRRGG